MPDAEGRLEQPGDARRALQVADVRLHRADPQRADGLAAGREHGAQRLGLQPVAAPGAGAVQFDVADVAGRDARPAQGGADDVPLRVGVRHAECLAAAVVVDRAAVDDADDLVLVGERPGQRLEQDDGGALAAYETVGAGVEGVALAVRGEHPELRGAHGALGDQVEVYAAGERELGLPAAQALAGQVDGDQGGGLARVHRHARAGQAEGVGEAVGDERPLQTGEGVRADRLGALLGEQGLVVGGDGADEDARGASADLGRAQAGVLEGLPAQLQHEPLLRVHRLGLQRGDAEELRVEAGHVVEEAAAPRVHAARPLRVPVVELLGVPAVGGDVLDGARPVPQEAPEVAWSGRARQAAGHGDHGDRFGRRVRLRVAGCGPRLAAHRSLSSARLFRPPARRVCRRPPVQSLRKSRTLPMTSGSPRIRRWPSLLVMSSSARSP